MTKNNLPFGYKIAFSITNDTNEYTFMDNIKVQIGSLLVDYLNLDVKWFTNLINDISDNNEQEICNKIFIEINKKYSIVFTTLLVNWIKGYADTIIEGIKGKIPQDDFSIILNDIGFDGNYLTQGIRGIYFNINCKIASNIQRGKILYSHIREGSMDYTKLLQDEDILTLQEAGHVTVPVLVDGKLIYQEQFTIDTLQNIFAIELLQTYMRQIHINKCHNCFHYFIPMKKHNEKYCDTVQPNGQTCKKQGWANIATQDEIYMLYRKSLDKNSKFVIRNKENKDFPHIMNNYKKWKSIAGNIKDMCQNKIITYDKYQLWLSESDHLLRKKIWDTNENEEDFVTWLMRTYKEIQKGGLDYGND